MRPLSFFFIFFPFLFFYSKTTIFAALSLSVNGLPTEISVNQEFIGDVSLSCSNCSDSYLRGTFFTTGSTNYSGYTQNDQGEWVNASNPKTIYFHIPPIESSWSGQLKFKLDSEKTSGVYQFKVIRYTSSGSNSGESDPFSINVINPVTPTPSSTPSPTKSPTPTPTSKSTPTPKPTATPIPNTPTPTPNLVVNKNTTSPTTTHPSDILSPSLSAEILSASDEIQLATDSTEQILEPSITTIPTDIETPASDTNRIPFYIGLSLICLGTTFFLIRMKYLGKK